MAVKDSTRTANSTVMTCSTLGGPDASYSTESCDQLKGLSMTAGRLDVTIRV